jgi:nucleoside-triphosphatase THEP1
MAAAPWALLVGGKGVDGSSLASRAATELAARGLQVGGVVQEPIERDGRRGYEARRVGGDERVVLAGKGAAPPGASKEALTDFCSFVFDERAFERAAGWIRAASNEADVVVIDEVSKLEVARGGHHDAVRDALGGRALVLLVVRGDQLFSVVERFELGEPAATLESGDEGAFSAFVEDVARAAEARRASGR